MHSHIFTEYRKLLLVFERKKKKNAARAGRQLRGMCNIEAPETRCHTVFHEMDFWWERIKVSGGRSAAWILSIVAGFRPFSSRSYPAENPLKQSTREKSAGTFPNGSWKRSDRVVGSSNGSKIKSEKESQISLIIRNHSPKVERRLFNRIILSLLSSRGERKRDEILFEAIKAYD